MRPKKFSRLTLTVGLLSAVAVVILVLGGIAMHQKHRLNRLAHETSP
jgi:hypothetical protein